MFLYSRPKSESPELVASVHEFPASNAANGAKVTTAQQWTQEAPVASSSLEEVAQENNATNLNGGRIGKIGPSAGLKAASVELRRSPSLRQSTSHLNSLNNERSLTELRRRIGNPPDPIETDVDDSQEHQKARNEEQPRVSQSPMQVAVSGVNWLPSRRNSPVRNNGFGEIVVVETGEKLSHGVQLPNERHQPASATTDTLPSYSCTIDTEPESAMALKSDVEMPPASQGSNVVDLEEDIEEQSHMGSDRVAKEGVQPDKGRSAQGSSIANSESPAVDEVDTAVPRHRSGENHPLAHPALTVESERLASQAQRKNQPGALTTGALEQGKYVEARKGMKRKALAESSKTDHKSLEEDPTSVGRSSNRKDTQSSDIRQSVKGIRSTGSAQEPNVGELDAFNVPDSDSEPKPRTFIRRAARKNVESELADSKMENDRQKLEREKKDRINARRRERRAEKSAQLAKGTNRKTGNAAGAVKSQSGHEIPEPASAKIIKKTRAAEADAVEEPRDESSNSSEETHSQKPSVGVMTGQQAEDIADEVETIALAFKGGQRHDSGTPARRILKLKVGAGLRNETLRRLREFTDTESTQSSSPSNHRELSSKRRSMTPLFPASSAIKPMKSALRTSESTNRRSVSFNDEAIIAPDALASVPSKASKLTKTSHPSRSSVGNRTVKVASSSNGVKADPSPPGESLGRHGNESLNGTQNPRTGSRKYETPSKDIESKPKVQTKLNVKRDVKLKGRAMDPPLPRKATTPTKSVEIIISSESERSASTYYSDEEDRARGPKAGPSSRKNLRSSMKSGELNGHSNKTLPSKSQSPEKSNGNVQKHKEASIVPQPKHLAQEPPRAMSKSRSPAQYMSRPGSNSSDPGSEASSRTASEENSASQSDSHSESEPDSESDTASGQREQSLQKPRSAKETKSSEHHNNHEDTHSSSSSATSSSDSDTEEEEDLAAQQLHRESHQSIDRHTPTTTSSSKPKKEEPSLPTKPPPTNKNNTRFPSLSTLRQQGRPPTQSKTVPDPRPPSDQPSASESDSDDESEDSSNDSAESGKAEHKPLSGGRNGVRRGLKSVLKRMFLLFPLFSFPKPTFSP